MIAAILVVCIGNICRSPIAEAMFRHKFQEIGKRITVSSAGLGALVDHPADPISQELLLAAGLDISKHRARQLTDKICLSTDLIITMSAQQTQQVIKTYPCAAGRTFRIGHWEGFDVPDPYRRPKIIFQQAYHLIEQGVDDWLRAYEKL